MSVNCHGRHILQYRHILISCWLGSKLTLLVAAWSEFWPGSGGVNWRCPWRTILGFLFMAIKLVCVCVCNFLRMFPPKFQMRFWIWTQNFLATIHPIALSGPDVGCWTLIPTKTNIFLFEHTHYHTADSSRSKARASTRHLRCKLRGELFHSKGLLGANRRERQGDAKP